MDLSLVGSVRLNQSLTAARQSGNAELEDSRGFDRMTSSGQSKKRTFSNLPSEPRTRAKKPSMPSHTQPELRCCGDITWNSDRSEISRGHIVRHLPRQQAVVFTALAGASGRTLTIDYLTDLLRPRRGTGPEDGLIHVLVHFLRGVMAELGSQTQIVSKRFLGYRMIFRAERFVTCRMSEAEYAVIGPILEQMRATGIEPAPRKSKHVLRGLHAPAQGSDRQRRRRSSKVP
jgi:hypothetical protein